MVKHILTTITPRLDFPIHLSCSVHTPRVFALSHSSSQCWPVHAYRITWDLTYFAFLFLDALARFDHLSSALNQAKRFVEPYILTLVTITSVVSTSLKLPFFIPFYHQKLWIQLLSMTWKVPIHLMIKNPRGCLQVGRVILWFAVTNQLCLLRKRKMQMFGKYEHLEIWRRIQSTELFYNNTDKRWQVIEQQWK